METEKRGEQDLLIQSMIMPLIDDGEVINGWCLCSSNIILAITKTQASK